MEAILLQQLKQSSDLPQVLEELTSFWEDEQRRRAEFYDWVTPDVKAEFINGEVIIHSPARNRHLDAVGNIYSVLRAFAKVHQLGEVKTKKAMCRFTRSDYEPDVCFFDAATAQPFTQDTTIFPVPQFIVEVLSPSTEERDRGTKFDDYERHGVGEYWLVDPAIQSIEQYLLRSSRYELTNTWQLGDAMNSPTFPGLRIEIDVFFDDLRALETVGEIVSR